MTNPIDLASIVERECALLPIRNQLIFPGCREEIQVVRPQSLALLASLDLAGLPVVSVFLQRDVGTQLPGHDDLYEVGVAVRVLEFQQHGDLGISLKVEGLGRVRRSAMVRAEPFLVAAVEPVDELEAAGIAGADELLSLAGQALPQLVSELELSRPGQLADRVAAQINASIDEQAEVLAAIDVADRVARTLVLVRRQLDWQASLQQLELPNIDTMKELWPLQDGALERIERAVGDGSMTAAEAEGLRHFREHGYIVWEGLIDSAEIDQLVSDIAAIREHPGRYLLTDHRRSRPFRASGPDFDHYENILDTYVNMESARNVCFHPTILRFLELLFDERPVATQQLLFQRSNIHPLHQDTAFVCMREPMLMVATWIALEDVVPGRGELTYYDGSHRVPHYRFADGSKRFQPELDDEDTAREHILRHCDELGCVKRDFIAKKGDVFLWAADLLHGSNPRTRSPEETRMSAVTHYCPESTEPLYFIRLPQHRVRVPYGERALIASSHYRLPTTEPVAQPAFPLPEPC